MNRNSLHLAAGLVAVCFLGCSDPAPTAGPTVISTQPASTTVVAGAGASFTVAATGNGTLTYQWRKDGAALVGSATASLALSAVTASNAGVYDCIVTNTVGGTTSVAVSSGAILAVNTAPVIVAQPVATSAAPGGKVVFMVAASGNGIVSYQWKKDGVDILGATQASYVIASAASANAGNYSCTVTNTLGATTTSTATAAAALTVTAGNPTAPALSAQPAALTVAAGDNASFTVAATANGTLTYQWRKDGVIAVGATSATLSLTAVTAANAGVYDCVVTNTLGGAASVTVSSGAALSVNTAPVILAQPTNQAAALGGSVTFTVVASGNGTLGYQWRKAGAAITGANAASLALASIAAGDAASYDCVVTNTLGSTATSTTSTAATLALATAPVITAQSGAQTIAQGGTATITVTATGSGLAFQWYKGSVALANGGSVSGATSATLTLTGLSLADAANYSCIVTSTVGAVSTTGTSSAAALVVVATPAITAQPAAITVAQGAAGSFTVAATTANGTLTYQWRKGGVAISGATAATLNLATVAAGDAGSYDCVVTNTIAGVANAVTSSAAVLSVNTSVTINAQPQSITANVGDAATLTVSASSTSAGVLSYQWQKGGVNIAGATSASLAFAALTAGDAASYTCVVTNTLGGTVTNVTSAVAVVAVNTVPVITVQPLAQGVATGATATFSVTATSTSAGTLTYQWIKTLGGVPTTVGNPSASYITPTITGAALATYDGATYSVVVTSTLGASPGVTTSVTSAAAALNVAVLPTLTVASSAGTTPNNFAGGEAAPTLTATITNTTPALNGAVTYQWKKGTVAILGATSATYTLPGTVKLNDAGSYTCTVSDTHNGAVASATSSAIVINVLAAPVISADLPAASYKNGTTSPTNGSISVTASAPAGGTLSYWWQVSTDSGTTWATASATSTSSSYSAPAYPTGSARQYRVAVTNTVGAATATVYSAVSTVTLYQTAQITTHPVATNVLAGASATLTVVPTALTIAGTSQLIQWYKGISTTVGVAIPGATSATLSIAAASAADANYYYAIVINYLPGAVLNSATSTTTSSIVRLGVNTAPSIVAQPASAPIATEGASFTLTVAAAGAPNVALGYQWQKGGANIAGANGTSYTIASPAAADAGTYTCVITSSLAGTTAQTVTTTPANLIVNQKPTGTTPVVTGDTTTGPITLTVTPTNPNTGSFLTYAWKRNGTAISGAILPVYNINEITSASAGNYTCDVSSVFVTTATSNNSTATVTSPIAVVGVGAGVTQPVVTLGATYTAGKTGIAVSTAAQAGATYEWSVTNGSVTAGAGTSAITVTAGSNVTLPMTATVVVTIGSGAAVGFASAAIVAAATQAMILAPASVHPGDTWMSAGVNNQGSTISWSVSGAGVVTGTSTTTGLGLPFSASSGAANGSTITLTANVSNVAGDAAAPATKNVAVTTGTWISKDGAINWVLGSSSVNTPGAAAAAFANGRVLVCGGQSLGQYSPASAAIYDPATQRWTRVADMNIGRTGHTATALNNGTILVTGGNNSNPTVGTTYLNSGEIYDPATNTWTLLTATNMGTGRVAHTATLLPGGAATARVVIAGGKFGSSDISPTISIFTPSGSAGNTPGGTFSTSSVGMVLPRERHTATALNDGRVLFVGGQGATNETYQQAEIFDSTNASTQLWSSTKVGSLTVQQRLYHTATLLLDGRVLIAGSGQSGAGNTAELFDPATGAFTATTGTLKGGYLPKDLVGSLNTSGRSQHGAARLADGRVLLTGGGVATNQGGPQSAELFDPTTQLFTNTTTPMSHGRVLHTTLALPNGTVMVLGGNGTNLSLSAIESSEIFDPAANAGAGSWTTIGSLNGRTNTAPVRLADGRVLLTGGQSEYSGLDPMTANGTSTVAYSRTTQIYNPATGNWTSGGNLATARISHSTVVLSNGKVLVAGGIAGQTINNINNLTSAEIFDPSTNAWTSAGNMAIPRVNFGMVALPGNKVLVMGGSSNGPFVNTSEIYDAGTNTWTSTTSTMSEVKYLPTPVLLSNGKVVVAGGNSPDSSTPTAAVELFDPATQTWTLLNPLSQSRTRAFPFALANGKFVLIGGNVVNPAFGNVVPAGGPINGLSGAIEIYDTNATPAAGGQGATVPTANAFFLFETRTGAGMSMLGNGKIMIAGGSSSNGGTRAGGFLDGTSTSEIYDPATDTLTAGPNMTVPAGNGVQAVTLLDGSVMLIGGSQTDTITQIYRP
jgi:hypothetical protein